MLRVRFECKGDNEICVEAKLEGLDFWGRYASRSLSDPGPWYCPTDVYALVHKTLPVCSLNIPEARKWLDDCFEECSRKVITFLEEKAKEKTLGYYL